MITMSLDWREVLWWLQGGMAGSHLRWSVYEDMVNKVWPQASEQERRNLFLIMRRDLGTHWRPDGWHGMDFDKPGEGPWREDVFDKTPWMYFRQVLSCFDPDNQYQVNLMVRDSVSFKSMLRFSPESRIISKPQTCHIGKDEQWQSDTATFSVRAYLWNGEYRIDWDRRCSEKRIISIEKLEIPDDGTM